MTTSTNTSKVRASGSGNGRYNAPLSKVPWVVRAERGAACASCARRTHYFPIYERHLARFRNTDVHVVEIGIYSGGSLQMWRKYFGPRANIVGVDIANATKVYEGHPKYGRPDRIVLGDQSSPKFWERFKKKRAQSRISNSSHAGISASGAQPAYS